MILSRRSDPAYNKAYYEKNKDRMKERARDWYWDNREAALSQAKEYNQREDVKARRRGQQGSEKAWRNSNPRSAMLARLRQSAKKRGIIFELTHNDLVIPDRCPILNIPLEFQSKSGHPNSPSVDRIDNAKGYTKDNIVIVSNRANTLKRDATIEELVKLAEFYSNLVTDKELN
jgi:hypothetical protein